MEGGDDITFGTTLAPIVEVEEVEVVLHLNAVDTEFGMFAIKSRIRRAEKGITALVILP